MMKNDENCSFPRLSTYNCTIMFKDLYIYRHPPIVSASTNFDEIFIVSLY